MEKHLYIHDNRDQLKNSLDNGFIDQATYNDAEVVAYGEGWEAMAKHVHDVKPLDRIIFEDCVESGGSVLAPHLNTNDIPYYRRPETIARNCDCSLEHATDLCQFWSTIGNTRELVKEFIQWVKAKGIAPALKYFGHLAAQLSAAECVSPEEFIESFQSDPVAPNTYRYHPVGEREEELDYYEVAPAWMKHFLSLIAQSTTLEGLKKLGSRVYSHSLGKHTGTFWMHYNMRKAELTPELSRKAGEIIGFIEKCRTRFRLGKYGKRLYELQNELPIPGAELAIAETDWSPIWEAYKEKKGEFGA
jgi:hypothetical protein